MVQRGVKLFEAMPTYICRWYFRVRATPRPKSTFFIVKTLLGHVRQTGHFGDRRQPSSCFCTKPIVWFLAHALFFARGAGALATDRDLATPHIMYRRLYQLSQE